MKGFHFKGFDPSEEGKTRFEQLLDIFMQLLTYTSGDEAEALSWLNELDRNYQLTDGEYGMGDFIDELREKGYITEDHQDGTIKITPRTEQGIRKKSLVQVQDVSKRANKKCAVHIVPFVVIQRSQVPGNKYRSSLPVCVRDHARNTGNLLFEKITFLRGTEHGLGNEL